MSSSHGPAPRGNSQGPLAPLGLRQPQGQVPAGSAQGSNSGGMASSAQGSNSGTALGANRVRDNRRPADNLNANNDDSNTGAMVQELQQLTLSQRENDLLLAESQPAIRKKMKQLFKERGKGVGVGFVNVQA